MLFVFKMLSLGAKSCRSSVECLYEVSPSMVNWMIGLYLTPINSCICIPWSPTLQYIFLWRPNSSVHIFSLLFLQSMDQGNDCQLYVYFFLRQVTETINHMYIWYWTLSSFQYVLIDLCEETTFDPSHSPLVDCD